MRGGEAAGEPVRVWPAKDIDARLDGLKLANDLRQLATKCD
jgi:hypothetical protein